MPSAIVDKHMPLKSTSLAACVAELQELNAAYPDSLKQDASVSFVISALTSINSFCIDLVVKKSNLIVGKVNFTAPAF